MGQAFVEAQDTGDFAEVPEDQRLAEDDLVPEEINEDAGRDVSTVPPGPYIVLSTASLDSPDDDEDEDEEEEF